MALPATNSNDPSTPLLGVEEYRRRIKRYNQWERRLTRVVLVVGCIFFCTSTLLYVMAVQTFHVFNPFISWDPFGNIGGNLGGSYITLKQVHLLLDTETKTILSDADI